MIFSKKKTVSGILLGPGRKHEILVGENGFNVKKF
jgi:hypothetical protein